MPIPKLKGRMTKPDIDKAYFNLGWKKDVVVNWVELNARTGQLVRKDFKFDARTMTCSNRRCSRHGLTYVTFAPHGVMWTCAICKRTMGPMAWEDAELLNGPMGTPIDIMTAWDIIFATGQKTPVGLAPVSGQEELIII